MGQGPSGESGETGGGVEWAADRTDTSQVVAHMSGTAAMSDPSSSSSPSAVPSLDSKSLPQPASLSLPLPAHAPTPSEMTVAYLTRVITEAEANSAAGPSSSAPDIDLLRQQLHVITARQREEQDRQQHAKDELRVQQLLQQFARPSSSTPAVTIATVVPASAAAAPPLKKARYDGAPDGPYAHHLRLAPPQVPATPAVVITRQEIKAENSSAGHLSAEPARPPQPVSSPLNSQLQSQPYGSHLPAQDQLLLGNQSNAISTQVPLQSQQVSPAPAMPSPAVSSPPPTALSSGPWSVPNVSHEEAVALAFADDVIASWQPQESSDPTCVSPTGMDQMGDAPPASYEAPWTPSMWLQEDGPAEPEVSSESPRAVPSPGESLIDADPVLSPVAYRDPADTGDASFDSDSSDADDADAATALTEGSLASRTLTAREHSRMLMKNYLKTDMFQLLEAEYRAGRFSAAAVRQTLVWISLALQPAEHDEFVSLFQQMDLRACEDALRSAVPAVGVGVYAADPTTASLSDLLTRNTVVNRGLEFSPMEAAPDDDDSVARIRFMQLMPKPTTRKRKKAMRGGRVGEEGEMVDDVASLTDESSAADQFPSAADLSLCLVTQVNRAYERTFGYTQAELVEILKTASMTGIMQRTIRRDHLSTLHRLHMRMIISTRGEGHTYQVRLRKDGSEIYCLTHMQAQTDKGMFLSSVLSIMPLPDDPDHPPPPYVDGVDLDEETLLHGYRPPQATTTDTTDSSSSEA